MARKNEIDNATGVETTGHEWDGIKELNNPLPRWWLIVFYATVVIAVIYWVLMPSWPAPPGFQGNTRGLTKNSERINVTRDISALKATRAPFEARLKGVTPSEIEENSELLQFAMAAGQSAFGDNCATCHGSGGQGATGYPNLNDDDWLWGGRLQDIRQTIQFGIRSPDDNTRLSQMPAFGRDKLLTTAKIDDLVEYVVGLSGRDVDAARIAQTGPLFAEQCATCHGADGKGNRSVGAPNLTDAVWMYGADRNAIRETIMNARNNVMPAWHARLDEATVNALAVYVHSLGGGE